MKKHMKNRILAVLLAAVLTAGNMSSAVFAASDDMAAESIAIEESMEEALVEEEVPEENSAPTEENDEEAPADETEGEAPAPEAGGEGETPVDGAESEAPAPEAGSAEETPADGTEEAPAPETGSEGETPADETEGEAPAPEAGSEGETPADETESETPAPEAGSEGETPTDGTESEASVPETGSEGETPADGTEGEAPAPETGSAEETPADGTEEGNLLNELLDSDLLEAAAENFSEEIDCTCGSEEEEPLLHAWDCPVFQEAFLELCDCGEESEDLTDHAYECAGVLKAFAALCNDDCGAYENQAAAHRCEVQDRLIEALCTCDSTSDDFSEHDEDCEYYQYMLGSINDMYGAVTTAITEKQSGTRISSSSVTDWTYNVGPYSSTYRAVLFRSGVSSLSTWANSGANVTTWTNTEGEECISMHPNDDTGSTKNNFGALYSKVVYDGSKWYDMKITVVNYTNSAVAADGSKVTVRPGIKFSKSRIAFYTNQKVGGMRVKIEFLETGTSTSANLNIRFQWWDIDDSQRFGFSATNASGTRYATVDHKYYKSTGTVVNRSYETVLGAQMEVLTGPLAQYEQDNDNKTQVVFELSNCSGYFMSFGPEDNIGDAYHQYVYTKAYYTQIEAAMQKGRNNVTVDHNGDGVSDTLKTINDLLVVTDASGIIETPAPTKSVSNDGSNWSTSNTLSSTTGEYYYQIRQEVPWQDASYLYKSFVVTDSLPAGVDYVSFHGVVDESGNDKTSLFTFSESNDVLTATAKAPSDSNFAGHWYTFRVKVKMDPTETSPSYSGNTATYTVQNTGKVTVQNNGSAASTKNTNTVTTTAKATAPTVPAPTKSVSNDGSTWSTSNTLSTTTSEYYYRVVQQVPSAEYAYRYESFSLTDTLPAGADYVALSSILNESGQDKSSLFNISASNDVITVTAKSPGADGFAGHGYTFTFKVKMDPTEISPSYSGNTATYEIKNTASVITKNAGLSSATKNTNEVTTRASSARPTQEDPKKGINQDESLTEYTMDSASEEVVFSIFQKVPAYDALWEPCTITMTDVLESCLEYVNCAVNLDGTELTDGWKVSANGQTITAVRANKEAYSGKTLRFDITCRVKDGYDLSSYQSVENGDLVATIPNTAKVKFVWSNAATTTVEKETNTVYVKLKENAINLIVKKTSEDTGENIPGAVFTVYEWDGAAYGTILGSMKYDVASQTYRMEQIVRTPENAGKFKVVETGVPQGYTGSWEKEFTVQETLGGGTTDLTYEVTNKLQRCTITIYKENEAGDRLAGAVFEIRAGADIVSPQGMVLVQEGTVVDTLTTDQNGTAVSKELYKGDYVVKETKAPDGYVIGTAKSLNPGEEYGVGFLYGPGTSNDEVDNHEVTFVNPMATVHLQLTKEIDTSDIVWAHGDPTFMFKVEGTDLCGNSHTYYEMVEFTKDNIGNGEKAVLTAEFEMPSGNYSATEEKTMRYKLDSIHSITGGELQGADAVTFDLTDGTDGSATFYNVKTTDEGLSHTVFVRNVMKEE